MKALVCEMCNSNDLIKQDGMYVCRNCGTKYTVEEAKKLMVDTPENTDNSDFAEKNENQSQNFAEKTAKKQAKKTYKKIIIIAVIVLVLSAGIFGGIKIYGEYKKSEILNNAVNDISNNTWKSLDSNIKFTLNKNGGSYGEYGVSKWNYNDSVLNITYEDKGDLFNTAKTYKTTLNLSLYQDDILLLTTEGNDIERFVKESDYDKTMKIIQQEEKEDLQGDGIKLTKYNYEKYFEITHYASLDSGSRFFVTKTDKGSDGNTIGTLYEKAYLNASVAGVSSNYNYEDVVFVVRATGRAECYSGDNPLKSEGYIDFEKDCKVECNIAGKGENRVYFSFSKKGAYKLHDVNFEIISVSGKLTPT